jgi:general stress protein 26
MPDPDKLETKFWRALRADMTVMLASSGPAEVLPRPMTAQLDGDDDEGPIWFFTSKDSELVQSLVGTAPAWFTFVSKGHDLFATVTGGLAMSTDRAVIDRLWNPFVAAWYEGGKDDPQLALLRFDPDSAEIWLDGSSLLAGLKMLLGSDPKKDYADNVAKVSL